MLAGLTSRWITPWLCATNRPRAVWISIGSSSVAGSVPVAVDVGQRVAGHVLHDEEADAVVLVILEQRGDVGVRQIGGIVRFRPQTVQLGLDVALIVAQRLDGDGTVELDVVAFPHLSHAALRQSAIQAVTAVDELSFDEFHCFRASSISERMIGPAASTPY